MTHEKITHHLLIFLATQAVVNPARSQDAMKTISRIFPIKHFTMISLLMGNGSTILNMVMYGRRMLNMVSNLMQRMDIGFIVIWDGHGYPIMRGAGRLSTMDDGSTIINMDGFGCRAQSGHPHG